MNDVTVCIPTIPPRAAMLQRAIVSVTDQTWPPEWISVALDTRGEGAAATRNRALETVKSEWVAFLDDDDQFLPHHLERLVAHADLTGADLVYPWYEGININLFAVPDVDGIGMVHPKGREWDWRLEKHLRTQGNFIPVTVLARTELIQRVGGFKGSDDPTVDQTDDWRCWIAMLDAGATFAHLPEATWRWNGHPGHTSGRRWTQFGWAAQ